MNALALLLADGRFPAGGHTHSGGVEAAVGDGRITDEVSLASYLAGRLATAGRVGAGLAAAACSGEHPVEEVDREAAARIASPALRHASRVQGRCLLRAAGAVLAIPMPAEELHHAVAIGVVARAAGMSAVEAARWAAYESVTGAATAAVRLLGLDPFGVWRGVGALAAQIEAIAIAASSSHGPLRELPACSAPLLDVGAERHALQEVRLFAS